MREEVLRVIRTQGLQKTLRILGVVIIALLVFQAGVFVGYRKAAFSYRFGDNYYRTFGPEQMRNRIPGMPPSDFLESNGASGMILKVTLPTFVLEGRDGVERVVRITDDTIIRQMRESLIPADLKEKEYVVVIGAPNDRSEIEARFIRLLPLPAEMLRTTLPEKAPKQQ